MLSSGYSLDGPAREIRGQGCKAFIQKPFSLQELSERVRAILDGGKWVANLCQPFPTKLIGRERSCGLLPISGLLKLVDTLLDPGQLFLKLFLIIFQFGLFFLGTQKTPGQAGASAAAHGLAVLRPLDIRFTTHNLSPPVNFTWFLCSFGFLPPLPQLPLSFLWTCWCSASHLSIRRHTGLLFYSSFSPPFGLLLVTGSDFE